MKYLYCSGYCNLNKCSSIKYICSLKITTQNEFYFQNSVFLLYHFLYSNTVDQNCHFWMPSNKNFQMHYYWLCNVDDYTQMKDIILITKFWKKKIPWKWEHCITICTFRFCKSWGVQEGMLIWLPNVTLVEKGRKMETWQRTTVRTGDLLPLLVVHQTGWNWCLPLITTPAAQ